MKIDAELIRALAALLDETGLTEIEVGEGTSKVRIARSREPAAVAAPAGVPTAAAAPPAAPVAAAADAAGAVASPMVGTVYLAPEPGAPAFVTVGSTVEIGDTLFIIEAMKTMNPVRAPRGGRVSRVLVENAMPVEYGQVLLVLE